MNRRSPLAQIGVFILVLIGLNVLFRVLGLQIQISIIGSLVLTVVVGGIMAATNR
ncbi:MAG: hypothetical protein ACR2QE_18395 [Acidimicrobiales bacterium]